MAKKFLKILSLVLALLLVFCACGTPSTAPENNTNTQPPAAKKHMNAAIYWSAATIDPAVEYDGWTSCRAGITETLVSINDKLELVPTLSDTWEQKDATTWVMHIRDGVTFHNGKAVDAAAVKACFERTMKIQQRAVTACKIESIEADGQTLTIHTSEPFGAFLANLTEPLYSVIDVSDPADPATAPVGTGPFMVTKFEPEEVIELAAYPGYWNGASPIDTVSLMTISDNSSRLKALQAEQIDIGQRIDGADIETLRNDPNYAVYETAGTRIRILIPNQTNPFLADVNVRKALEYSLNYDALLKIMGDTFSKAGAPFPSSAPYGYDKLEIQHYDLEKAKECLKTAGFEDKDGNGFVEKDGKELALTLIYSDTSMNTVLESVQFQAKAAGINIVLKPMDSIPEVTDTDVPYDLMLRNTQSLSTGDPQWLLDNMFKSTGSSNFAHYNNPEMDAICNDLSGAFDFATRQKLTIKAEELILKDSVQIMLFSQNNFIMANNKVKNVPVFPIDYYFLTNTMDID